MSKDNKKRRSRDDLKHFAHSVYKSSWEHLSAPQQSIALTRFYIQEIYNQFNSEISEDDIELGVVDGANDLGIDFIHKEDDQVLIIQAKYRGTGKSEDPESISHFQQILSAIADPNIRANRWLEDKLHDVDLRKDFFHLVFITFGTFGPQVTKRIDAPPSFPVGFDDLDQRCKWEFLDENKIDAEYDSALSITKGPTDSVLSLYPPGIRNQRGKSFIEVDAGKYKSYIMALSATSLVDAYNRLNKDAIFSLNIRNYIGKTRANKEIREASINEADKFFLFNNGISCLCTKLVPHDDRIDVTGLQIINGAQTVKTLVQVSRNRSGVPPSWQTNPPIVLTRITEIPEGYGQDGKLREQITKSNNTQNVIKDADFRSNDAVQVHLKEQFSDIRRAGKKVVYVAKRSDEREKNVEVVKVKEFAKIVYAFLQDQISYSDSMSFLFDDSERGGYNKVFGDGDVVWPKIPTDEFHLRAAIYWLGMSFAQQLKKDRQETADVDERAALERKWAVIYAARVTLQLNFDDEDWKKQVKKLYKGDWQFGVEQYGKWVERLYGIAKTGVVMTYRNARESDPKFTQRGWTRSSETPIKIRNTLKDLKSVMPKFERI